MLKTEFPFERFLEIVLPGAVFSIGLWYIHRPFLAVYFPTVASMVDSSATETASFASKATVFFCLTLVLGMALRSLADIGVAALFADESHTEKSKRWTRRLAEYVVRILLFHGAPDPRVRAVDRYLLSERKREFLEVAKDWAFHRGPLERNDQKVLVHQHLVARLKVRSAEARALIGEALQPVIVFSGVFVSLLLLIAFGLLGFFSNWIVSGRITTHSHSVLIGILFTVYGLAWLVGYALRRAMRQFAAHVLTLALHYYAEATIAGSTSKDVHADSKQEKSC